MFRFWFLYLEKCKISTQVLTVYYTDCNVVYKAYFFLFKNMFVTTVVKVRECNINCISRFATFNKFFECAQIFAYMPTGVSCLKGIILFFYVLLTVHPCIIFFKWSQLGAHDFLVYLFQHLYMFRATMCPSSEELTVSMQHWYFSLCMGGCLICWLTYQTATYTERKLPVSHRYSMFSWWWAQSCPKNLDMLKEIY